MRIFAFLLLFVVFCYVECRKTYAPIDKNANLAFINMESGGLRQPPNNVGPAPVSKVPASPSTLKPLVPEPVKPNPANYKPVPQVPVKPTPQPVQPTKIPNQITPKPVNPAPAIKPVPTPGPGSVKQLVTFYDSQGKASPIRPYSYSQAVKQG